MDAERREFLKQLSGRRLVRLIGATVFAGLDAAADLKAASYPSPEEAGMALRGRGRRGPPAAGAPAGAEAPAGGRAEDAQAPP
jgi:hypothetical protein